MNLSENEDLINEARYICQSCDQRILSPGEGHLPSCLDPTWGVEYLHYHPAPYIVKDGKYYMNLAAGALVTRRIRQAV